MDPVSITCSLFVMSHVYAYALPIPYPNKSATTAVSSLLSLCMSKHITVAPSIENWMANSRPTPRPAPAICKYIESQGAQNILSTMNPTVDFPTSVKFMYPLFVGPYG